MKTNLFQILGVVAIGVLSFNSCTTDACKDVNCGQYGTCLDGDCVCDTGYEGVNCQTEERAKFVATYVGTIGIACPVTGDGNLTNQTITISNSSVSVSKITINIAGNFTLTATVAGTSLTIDNSSQGGFNYSGTGSVNGNNLTISLNEEEPGVETCVYTVNASKQ
jgi:hypothetical protein